MSDDPADLAAIYDSRVGLVSIRRQPSAELQASVAAWLARRPSLSMSRVLDASELRGAGSVIVPCGDDGIDLAVLRADVDWVLDAFSSLLGCASVGVRAKVLHRPMCPRFHVDRIPCRMLVSYGGPATEWIAADDVDWSALGPGDAGAYPVRPGRRHRSLATWSVSLMKGSEWDGDCRGVVHRSPQAQAPRLLLSIDPTTLLA